MTEVRSAHDGLDAFDRLSQHLFENTCDSPLGLYRHQAIVEPDDGAHGHLDIWEDVGRCFEHCQRPEHQDEDRENDEGVRLFNGNLDKLIHPKGPLIIAIHCCFQERRRRLETRPHSGAE